MGQTEFVHSTAPGSPCRSASEAARFDPRVVGSAREGSDGDEGLGSLEEEGELPARSPGRGPLRSLQVHVSTTGARRLSLGPRADPRLGHLRQVHAPPLTGPNRLGSRIAVAGGPDLCRTIARSLAERVRRRHRMTCPGGWAADPRMSCAIGVSPRRTIRARWCGIFNSRPTSIPELSSTTLASPRAVWEPRRAREKEGPASPRDLRPPRCSDRSNTVRLRPTPGCTAATAT